MLRQGSFDILRSLEYNVEFIDLIDGSAGEYDNAHEDSGSTTF